MKRRSLYAPLSLQGVCGNDEPTPGMEKVERERGPHSCKSFKMDKSLTPSFQVNIRPMATPSHFWQHLAVLKMEKVYLSPPCQVGVVPSLTLNRVALPPAHSRLPMPPRMRSAARRVVRRTPR